MAKKTKRKGGKQAPGALYRSALARSRTQLKKLKGGLLKDLHAIGADPRSTKAHRERMLSLYLVVLGAEHGLDSK